MTIPSAHLQVLREIRARLEDGRIDWVVTGSLGLALQGVNVGVHDVDIQTDRAGAYEIERRFSEQSVRKVFHRASDRVRSHFGTLWIGGIEVEIMGDMQYRRPDGTWEPPVDLRGLRKWVEVEGISVPVLPLEHEYQGYLKLGRDEKAAMLRAWLDR